MSFRALFSKMTLSKEAYYLNSVAFMFKTGIIMVLAFAIGKTIPIVNRDMISFLFALMLSLEPVNITGLKRGLDQFKATLVGACVSAIILFFVGINPLGLGLSIFFILYFTLARNWRELSVVALFTGIYMTQFIQTNAAGEPSLLMTMLVRIVALTAGILFAMLSNYVASFFFHKKLPKQRLGFLIYRLTKHLNRLIDKLNQQTTIRDKAHLSLSSLFNDIDWTLSLFTDLKKEKHVNQTELAHALVDGGHLRDITHYLLDLEMCIRHKGEMDQAERSLVLETLGQVKAHFETGQPLSPPPDHPPTSRIQEDCGQLISLTNALHFRGLLK